MALDIHAFTTSAAPALFASVDAIRPQAVTTDLRVLVEQYHYSVEIRESLLTFLLLRVNQRFQPGRFPSVAAAREWADALDQTVRIADASIQKTRTLLMAESGAANDYLAQITSEIETIEQEAAAKLLLLRRIKWLTQLNEAETEVNDLLAMRSAELENVLQQTTAEPSQIPALSTMARRALSTAPKVGGLFAVGAAALMLSKNADKVQDIAATAAAAAAESRQNLLGATQTAPRGAVEPAAAVGTVNLDAAARSATQVGQLAGEFTAEVARQDAAVAQAEASRSRVDEFFNRLPNSTGRQTLVIADQSELSGFITKLTAFGYTERAILDLLGLPSASAFSQPITLDLRHGQQMPILFPRANDAQVTQRLAAIPQVRVVYTVQGGENLDALAQRFSTTAAAIASANPTINSAEPLQTGQRLVLAGPVVESAQGMAMALANGSTLDQVAALFQSDPQTLATLNNIQASESWRLQGGTLDVPAAAIAATLSAPNVTAAQPAVQGAAPAAQTTASAPAETAAQPAMLQPGESFTVYRVQPDDTLEQIAARYGIAIEQITSDNNLATTEVSRGQRLMLRRPAGAQAALTAGAQSAASEQAASSATTPAVAFADSASVSASAGSFGAPAIVAGAESIAANVAQSVAGVIRESSASYDSNEIVARYGNELFPSIEAMPDDARGYLLGTTQEVADFFSVRPGDILGIMRQEQNNAGWRLQEERVSSAGATGVGQVVARTWNGWSNPSRSGYVRNVAEIEEHGGLGFDWASREAWREWKYGGGDRALLANSNADPTIFENSVAAIARHLVHWGLTREFAERDPQAFADRLADAIAVYNSGRTLEESANYTQSSANHKTTAQYVADAMAVSEAVGALLSQPSVVVASPEAVPQLRSTFRDHFDRSLGQLLPDAQLDNLIARQGTILEAVRSGQTDPQSGALQLLAAVEQQYMNEGYHAIASGTERPWPFVHNAETLYAQHTAVSLLGRTLSLHELDDLMNRTRGDREQIRLTLMGRADARLYTQARYLYDQLLQRSASGEMVYTSEVTALLQPLMAGHSPVAMDDATLRDLIGKFQGAVESLDEYSQLHGEIVFKAMPLNPMPGLIRGFGAPINYQAGGRHTGIDVANPLVNGQEPEIFAVADATVEYVGPLYCEQANACRGGKAILLDHGNNVYSIYSHNSLASVRAGDRVTAGQSIGRQGNEGYSFGSHLHFEVHVGAPFSGNWERPFEGGEFVDPMAFLPGAR